VSSHFGWVDFAEDHRRKEGVCLSPEIKELWLEAVPPRAGGGGEIGLPQHHRPILYEAVMDLKRREILLNDAFN